eukprot:364381-Chlamydomonas_euryale.AAC.5
MVSPWLGIHAGWPLIFHTPNKKDLPEGLSVRLGSLCACSSAPCTAACTVPCAAPCTTSLSAPCTTYLSALCTAPCAAPCTTSLSAEPHRPSRRSQLIERFEVGNATVLAMLHRRDDNLEDGRLFTDDLGKIRCVQERVAGTMQDRRLLTNDLGDIGCRGEQTVGT